MGRGHIACAFKPCVPLASYNRVVRAVLMSGHGGRIGGQRMSLVQRPAVTPKHEAWNKGRIIGQKQPLLPKRVWAIRVGLDHAENLRDLTLLNVAIGRKPRGCDLVKDDRVREGVSVIQGNIKRPARFELSESTRETVNLDQIARDVCQQVHVPKSVLRPFAHLIVALGQTLFSFALADLLEQFCRGDLPAIAFDGLQGMIVALLRIRHARVGDLGDQIP